jgi:hypothetical protein
MFRGAIEVVTDNAISGWVYSNEADLTGRTLLAFVGERCVGSGPIEIFRQDLKDAGLGDGRYGFHFGITVDGPAAAPIVVKFEASDAILMPPDGRLTTGRSAAPVMSRQTFQLKFAQLSWQSERGVVKPADFILLRDLLCFGYCSRDAAGAAGGTGTTLAAALAGYEAMLSLAMQAHVTVESVPIGHDLAGQLRRLAEKAGPVTAVGVFSEAPLAITLERASHLEPKDETEALARQTVTLRLKAPKFALLDTRLTLLEIGGGGHLLLGRVRA